MGRSLKGLSHRVTWSIIPTETHKITQAAARRGMLWRGVCGERKQVRSSPGRVDGVDGAGRRPPELLRDRSCQTLTEWKEKPEKRLTRGKWTWIPGSVEGGSCPLSPLAQQRGKALSISSVTVIAPRQHLLPFSASCFRPCLLPVALLTKTSWETWMVSETSYMMGWNSKCD